MLDTTGRYDYPKSGTSPLPGAGAFGQSEARELILTSCEPPPG